MLNDFIIPDGVEHITDICASEKLAEMIAVEGNIVAFTVGRMMNIAEVVFYLSVFYGEGLDALYGVSVTVVAYGDTYHIFFTVKEEGFRVFIYQ